jgi:hypothetical protein
LRDTKEGSIANGVRPKKATVEGEIYDAAIDDTGIGCYGSIHIIGVDKTDKVCEPIIRPP